MICLFSRKLSKKLCRIRFLYKAILTNLRRRKGLLSHVKQYPTKMEKFNASEKDNASR